MTETQEKALALVNEVREGRPYTINEAKREYGWCFQAVCRAIEQHEAFRQEVSDAVKDTKFMVETHCDTEALALVSNRLNRFIIAKPDPLVEAHLDVFPGNQFAKEHANKLRAAIEKRGGKIVWGEGA